MTDVLNGLRHSEHYRYDSQLNLTQKAQRETDALGQYQFEAANDASFGMKQRNGRITRFGNKTYKYDELGRLHSKTETKKGFRPVTTYYKWNSQSQLVELHSPFKGSWRYEFDSFGRRITKYQIQTDQPQPNQVINMPIRANQDYWHKINELWAKEEQSQGEKTSQKLTALSGYRYLYKQNQLVAEAPLQINGVEGNLALTQANWADAIYWLYQEDDFTPTARYEKGQLHYTVADQVGTITELLTEDGYIDYRQKLNLWGEAEIDGHRHYAVEELQVNPDGTKVKKFITQFPDGNLSKIKKSTTFPEGWSDTQIIDGIKATGDTTPIGTRPRDGAILHRKTVDGVQIEVIKIGDDVVSGYPTGGTSTHLPSGFQ